MAKKPPAQAPLIDVSVPTMLRTRLPDGRLLGVDGSVWLIRRVPLEPVVDAKSVDERMNVFTPLLAAYDELSAMTPVTVTRRAMARKDYRQTQLLMVNLNRLFNPTGHPMAEFLKRSFPAQITEKRMLFLAVKLASKVGGSGGLKAAIESVTETLTVGGAPLSDYDVDLKKVDAALARCGLTTPSSEELSIANSWWNQGHFPDTVDLPHSDHLHVFSDAKAVRMADDAGRTQCHEWPEIPNHRTLTFATLEDFEFDFIAPTDTKAHWATGLLDDDAVAISIRAGIEPAKITRAELRRQRKRYMDDIRERVEQHKMERAEQDEMLQTLEDVEGVYGSNGGSPTLVDASVLIAFDGEVEDITQAGGNSQANLRIMNFRQRQALAEMMLCSYIRANPNLHDLPSQTVACSGIQSLSTVGDKTGALLGFTERDKQPAYVSPTAASTADGLPIFLNVGGTGSGKSQVLLWKAVQYSEMGGPQVIIDPKTGSDHSPTVLAAGGQVSSLDDLANSDGVFDPIRFSLRPEVGVEMAASMLSAIDPWGGNAARFEVAVYNALSYGVANGAQCVGQALHIAQDAGKATEELVRPVFELADSSPMFRACVGMNPKTKGLRIHDGITLIKVGDSHLDLPEPGAIGQATLMQRVCLALVRMMVFGSAMALTGRGGAIHLDEAWVFLGAGKSEVERLGRLARSQNVLPELYTQRVSDALKAELTGYISRGLILPVEDATEARAACQLFKLDPTPERMARITAKAEIGDGESVALNWNSMKALRDPNDPERRVLRGAIGIYADLAGRAVPVEIVLPKSFLALSSTSPDDIRRRDEAALARELERRQEAALAVI
ncbi:ATP-binding protein [Arthrobacter sp. zg-Y1110]|uniref:ATP-binding protein n=1 Tax=Arthrobacter sp. zg-Y1110 TaxID=2886932 RepID=UPI001D145699|nr:ATP-binding protein [Arthrobacter sp. zg-Y1110]MCC3292847.1 ATP-binding protein [Arthrobacter sp. zg-Y1110]UWX86786.1 ATP-binding protein [Arthrobacter sp. zg-Y1110]